ncbi:MAG TPA: DUF6153 family protein [Nocardioides sp.]|nr:DUF6153 family protein [Nocardioides sp.]
MTVTPAVRARICLVRLLLLGGAVAGLFMMHGLGDHGTAHHVAGSSHAAVAMSGEQPGHMTPAGTTSGNVPHSPTRTSVSAPTDAGSGEWGLCMAVLAGVLFALAGLREWGRLPAMVAPRLVSSVRFTATARERDPPRLVQLSICRC